MNGKVLILKPDFTETFKQLDVNEVFFYEVTEVDQVQKIRNICSFLGKKGLSFSASLKDNQMIITRLK